MAQMLVVDGDQLGRLMRICRAICTGGGVTVQQLQTKLRISRRTIFRHLNSLETMGVTVELGEQGYCIRQSAAQCKKLLAESHTKALNKLLSACLK